MFGTTPRSRRNRAPRSSPGDGLGQRLRRAVGVPDEPAPPPSRSEKVGRLLKPLVSAGFAGSQIASWIAMSPSLIPRTWWMTAISVGLSQGYGYGFGSLVARAGQAARSYTDLQVTMDPAAVRRVQRAGGAVFLGLTLFSWARMVRNQREISLRMDMEPKSRLEHLGGLAASYAISGGILLVYRGLRLSQHQVDRVLGPFLPRLVLPLVSTAVVGTTAYVLFDRVVYDRFVASSIRKAEETNALIMPTAVAPTEPERSGSPASREPFETLGARGRVVVADGPRRADIERWSGRSAQEPIRVYVGKIANRTIDEAARAMVAELHRTGAFERKHLALFTGTGTGWLQEWSLSAFEYLTEGDCAIASIQYSVVTSGISYIADRRSPRIAGRAMYDAVMTELARLPKERRPKLYVSGESLGAYGALAAFRDAGDMLTGLTGGAVLTGTPRFTPVWKELTARSRRGMPEIAPVVSTGRHARFATHADELTHDYWGGLYEEWQEPRILFVQHSSDPVVWWQPSLLWQEPRWLREQAGRDVTRSMRWWPWITFWQVASDMPLSISVPGGHGHSYHEEMVTMWAGVLGLDPTVDRGDLVEEIRRTSFRGEADHPVLPDGDHSHL
jgi:uncharacterized membrane protein